MYLQQGFSDNPQTSDALGIEVCCQGIADFVRTCSTPMTLAIQGDWGTGKTTAMNLIGNCLQKAHPEGVCLITFNTWQFSVLNENEKLIVDLMNE